MCTENYNDHPKYEVGPQSMPSQNEMENRQYVGFQAQAGWGY